MPHMFEFYFKCDVFNSLCFKIQFIYFFFFLFLFLFKLSSMSIVELTKLCNGNLCPLDGPVYSKWNYFSLANRCTKAQILP